MQVTKFRVWLFSLLLVCFQQLGFAHAVSHFQVEPHAFSQEADHPEVVCELCELHAQTGTGLLPLWAPHSPTPLHLAPVPQPGPGLWITRFSHRYHSRAPPVLA